MCCCFKNYYSIGLLRVKDRNYKFIVVYAGSFGKESKAGVLDDCPPSSRTCIMKNRSTLIKSSLSSTDNIGLVFLGDEAFLLTENLKRPFNELNYKEKITCYITDCPEQGW